MKNNLKLEEAISRLADLFEYGHLQADMDPVGFIDTATARIKELEEDFTAKGHRIAELEQALRAEIDHSKQLVSACRSCKKVQELEKSTKWYVDFTRAQDKSLCEEIKREDQAESLVEHLRSEVDSLQNDLSIAKEGNKRYRAQLSQRNGLLTADKAIK